MNGLSRPSRILYVCHASPVGARLGPARRHFHILDQLARFFDVSLLSLGEPSDGSALRRDFGQRVASVHIAPINDRQIVRRLRKAYRTVTGRCDFLPVLEPGLQRHCDELTSTGAFDAIVLSSVLLRGLPLPGRVPLVGDTHNVEFDVLRRTAALADRFLHRHYASRQWPVTREEERRCAANVDLLLATSARDREVFQDELGIRDVAVIPNGIDPAEFRSRPGSIRRGTIVFSGLMSYYPNQQAVRWFLVSIFPRILRKVPFARLIVAGAAPPTWLRAISGDRVEVTGHVPDIRPYLERASVVIAPLFIGGGTRVKILEAMAMRRPVVSTSLGAEGLDLDDRQSVLVADDAESFAARVIDLLCDRALAARIAGNGQRHVAHHFDWNQIGLTLKRVLETRVGVTARDDSDDAGMEPQITWRVAR